MTTRDDSPAGRLSRALAAAAPPAELVDAMTTVPPEPRPGQLWRARREHRSVVVLLIDVNGTHVTMAPVTVDQPGSDDAVDLPVESSSLRAPLTVWVALRRDVPTRTLEQYLGETTIGTAEHDVLAAVTTTGRPGPAPVSPADPQVMHRAHLQDDVEDLAAAPLPGGTGELSRLLAAADLHVDQIGELLELSTPAALAVLRGRRPVDSDQAARLAAVLQLPADAVLDANPAPPAPLVAWMSQPAQRRNLRRLASRQNIAEDSAFARATFATYATAARTAGDRTTDSAWAALGQRYFEAVLGDD